MKHRCVLILQPRARDTHMRAREREREREGEGERETERAAAAAAAARAEESRFSFFLLLPLFSFRGDERTVGAVAGRLRTLVARQLKGGFFPGLFSLFSALVLRTRRGTPRRFTGPKIVREKGRGEPERGKEISFSF